MGKKETRKETKKKLSKKENKKKLKEMERIANEENSDMGRLIKIFCGVVGALVLFGLIFAFFNGELFKKKEKEQETIQYSEIMAGNIFNRGEEEFYVLMYKYDGDNDKYFASIYNTYQYKTKDVKMYVVNLSSGLNKAYLTEDAGSVNVSDGTSLKVVDGTLLRVNNGKVVESYFGRDKIEPQLSELLNKRVNTLFFVFKKYDIIKMLG